MEEYTVKQGDTFSSIAQEFYGDVKFGRRLWQANRSVGGVGNTDNELNYEHNGHNVVLTIPDEDDLPAE